MWAAETPALDEGGHWPSRKWESKTEMLEFSQKKETRDRHHHCHAASCAPSSSCPFAMAGDDDGDSVRPRALVSRSRTG
jgi:hypothetical protein